jgi:hypothetical protein
VLALIHAKFAFLRPEWMEIVLSLVLSYATFILIALGLGLDSDDRLIAAAVWSRVRSMFPTMELGS